MKGQQNLQTNNGPNVSGQTDNQTNEGKAAPDDLVTIKNTTNSQADKLSSLTANQATTLLPPVLLGVKGVIALDDDKNTVVRFFDKQGKLVSQYPPEDYVKMMKELNQVTENLFHKTV